MTQPVAGAAIQQLMAGEAFQQPVEGPAFQQPVAGAAFQQPVAEAAFQQPVAGAAFQQPVAGAAIQQLTAGEAFQQPVAEADFQQPVAGAAFQKPVAGAIFQPPVAAAAFQQPMAEEAFQQPVAEEALQQLAAVYYEVICRMTSKAFIIIFSLQVLFILANLYFYGVTRLIQKARLVNFILQSYWPVSRLQSNWDIVDEAMKCNADGICLTDYALESAGGMVLYSSETYSFKSGLMYSLFGLKLWYHPSSSQEVIQPGIQPGRCWAMDGSFGIVVIQLAMPIILTAVSLEHTPINLSASTDIDSIPRRFVIFGLERSPHSPEVAFGIFTYKIGKESIQRFEIKDPVCLNGTNYYSCRTDNKIFSIIVLGILNNYGNPNFTCIYRFRVHGQPVSLSPTDWF